jgi:putative RecB family exonuclease
MYPVPTSLSPSRVESFTSCPLAFRFVSLDRIPEPPSVHTARGSLVHRCLELLFTAAPSERTPERAEAALVSALAEFDADPEYAVLGLTEATRQKFEHDARQLVASYFRIEDPRQVRDIGLELRLEANVGDLTLRGIIDRLELDDDGKLVVTDYKTGRAPGLQYEQTRLAGVHFYSFLCEQLFGQRPAAIRLMYLSTGEVITATPSQQSVRYITTRTTAVWKAVEKACHTGDFRPRQGALCSSCHFQPWCPAFGGDPSLAIAEAPLRIGQGAATASAA